MAKSALDGGDSDSRRWSPILADVNHCGVGVRRGLQLSVVMHRKDTADKMGRLAEAQWCPR